MKSQLVELEDIFHDLLEVLGEDADRGGLLDTPLRAAKAWQEWTAGYGQDPADVLKVFDDGATGYNGMVTVGNIPVFSHCEHHLAPFFGVAHIGYVPRDKVVGLSKLTRLVGIFANRLQIQERLTTQIAEALQEHLNPEGVGVVIRCRHLCMESRGVRSTGSTTTTSSLQGEFYDDAQTRSEFMRFVELATLDKPHI